MGLVILDMWELYDCNIACGRCLSYVDQSGSGRCASRCGSWAAIYFTANQVGFFHHLLYKIPFKYLFKLIIY